MNIYKGSSRNFCTSQINSIILFLDSTTTTIRPIEPVSASATFCTEYNPLVVEAGTSRILPVGAEIADPGWTLQKLKGVDPTKLNHRSYKGDVMMHVVGSDLGCCMNS
jgi:hypothetical protein